MTKNEITVRTHSSLLGKKKYKRNKFYFIPVLRFSMVHNWIVVNCPTIIDSSSISAQISMFYSKMVPKQLQLFFPFGFRPISNKPMI